MNNKELLILNSENALDVWNLNTFELKNKFSLKKALILLNSELINILAVIPFMHNHVCILTEEKVLIVKMVEDLNKKKEEKEEENLKIIFTLNFKKEGERLFFLNLGTSKYWILKFNLENKIEIILNDINNDNNNDNTY